MCRGPAKCRRSQAQKKQGQFRQGTTLGPAGSAKDQPFVFCLSREKYASSDKQPEPASTRKIDPISMQ